MILSSVPRALGAANRTLGVPSWGNWRKLGDTHEKADISMEGLIRMVDGFGALIRASVSITSRFDYVYEEIIIDIE